MDAEAADLFERVLIHEAEEETRRIRTERQSQYSICSRHQTSEPGCKLCAAFLNLQAADVVCEE
jgi:hypothetical protein